MNILRLTSLAMITLLSISGFSKDLEVRVAGLEEAFLSSGEELGYSNSRSQTDADDHERRIRNLECQAKAKQVLDSAHGCISGFSIEGEFLWWRAHIDSLDYVVSNNSPLGPTPDRSGRFHEPNFEFDPGVRVSMGYDFGHQNWDIFLRWTYHYTSPTHSISINPANAVLAPTRDFFAPSGDETITFSESASIRWTDRINVLDFEMGYDHFFSRRFSIRPNFGVKAAWIDMDNSIRYGDATALDTTGGNLVLLGTVRIRNKTDFWGVGPSIGIDGYLHIGWGVSLYTTASTAFLYGQYDTTLKQSSTLPTPSSITIRQDDFFRQRAMGQLIVGAEWATCFSEKYMLSLHVGWEGQYWWDQSEFRYAAEAERSGDLTFTGLDVGARFDF